MSPLEPLRWLLPIVLSVSLWELGASAQTPPSSGDAAAEAPVGEDGVDALVFDIVRIVNAEESDGWLLDEVDQADIHPTVMRSVCRASPALRTAALARLEAEARARGDARSLYERSGQTLTDDVERALSASRRVEALRRAVASAARQCPFWLHPDPHFEGLQSTRNRPIVNFDTGGTVQLRRPEGAWTLGAGGFGRVLAGYSFTRLSLLAGLELGGGAMLQPNTRPVEFLINYFPAVPVIVRLHQEAWHLDLEAASVALFQAGNTQLSYGVRGGLTVGISALRLRGIMPWVGLAVASEYHFESAARPGAFYLRSGLRVGGVWDP